ncbi:MAG: tRNA pseudouridine32 synthase/23S rRNA pseudouridine746 synthase [Pseudohongiellaceae bacterium]|jgi:tRNA pseudouridine32 synthase/23S rRNA pseudouridine746 synthase
MAIASTPSKLSLPQNNPGVTTVLEFLALKFPAISYAVWQQRMADGKVHWHDGRLIRADSPFAAQQRVYYYREVDCELVVPFTEEVLFQDELLLVAFKPHFLPVTPGGGAVEQCLQNRLRNKTGNHHLQALHRLDKATAGLVLFSVERKSRQHYHRLFANHQVSKTYQAIANSAANPGMVNQQWDIKNRLEKAGTGFLMHIAEGPSNSHSRIRCLQCSSGKALFELHPITGKTHQLRLHMQSLGWPILNDTFYPTLLDADKHDDYDKPLQLLAQQLQFVDPITQQTRHFSSGTELSLE